VRFWGELERSEDSIQLDPHLAADAKARHPVGLFLLSHAGIALPLTPFATVMGRALLFDLSEKGSPFLSQQ
jgi:hypothetical protein